MAKMAVMSIYCKIDLKFFISGTERQVTLKLGLQHWGLWSYIVCTNDDLWFADFTIRSIEVSETFVREKGKTVDIQLSTAKRLRGAYRIVSVHCPSLVVSSSSTPELW